MVIAITTVLHGFRLRQKWDHITAIATTPLLPKQVRQSAIFTCWPTAQDRQRVALSVENRLAEVQRLLVLGFRLDSGCGMLRKTKAIAKSNHTSALTTSVDSRRNSCKLSWQQQQQQQQHQQRQQSSSNHNVNQGSKANSPVACGREILHTRVAGGGGGLVLMVCLKGLYWEPQIGNPKNIAGISWNVRTLVGIFLLYTYYILGVPSRVPLL